MSGKFRFATAGFIIGLLAVGLAVFQEDLRSAVAPEPPPLHERILDKGREILDGERGETPSFDAVDVAYRGLGIVALSLGLAAFMKNESTRASAVAGALGLAAIAWHYVLIGVAIAIIIIVLANFA